MSRPKVPPIKSSNHSLDDLNKVEDNFVHLARLALTGKRQDVLLLLRRASSAFRGKMPEMADELNRLLREATTSETPLRGDTVAIPPVDLDSRLSLATVELLPELAHEPIWPAAVAGSLQLIVDERRREPELSVAGLQPTRTALFEGPPGVGKTLAAHWLARELRQPLITLDLSAAISSFLGRTGANVRNVLDYARGVRCVLLLDEFDAIAKRRDDTSEIGELKRLVSVLLQEIDNWTGPSLLIAATNYADLLDHAIWRRFDVTVNFSVPDPDQVPQAVRLFLGDDIELEPNLTGALELSFIKCSFSEIERVLTSIRREAVVRDEPIDDLIKSAIRKRAQSIPKSVRFEMGTKLQAAGLSDRQVHDLIGVSRDTLRKRRTAATLR